MTCQEGYNCVTTAHAFAAFACCNNVECLSDWGLCQEYGAQKNCNGYSLPPATCSSIYGSILSWYGLYLAPPFSLHYADQISSSSDAPYCYRYARSTSRGAYLTQYSWACGTASTDILVLATATNDQDPAGSATSNAHASIPGYTYGSYPSAASNPSSSTTTTKGGLTVRSIVLIVIFGGGTVLVALVCAWFFISQKRKQNRNKKHSTYTPQTPQPPPAYPMATNAPMPMPMQSPGPGYQWNNGAPMGQPPNGAFQKPPEIVSTVHEVPAPVRALHEMPSGQDMSGAGVAQRPH